MGDMTDNSAPRIKLTAAYPMPSIVLFGGDSACGHRLRN
jgi:hypothetical protein